MSYVYKIVNLINNKMYVGKSNCPHARFMRHCALSIDDDRPLYVAMRKYGIENFEYSILDVCDSEDAAFKQETYRIRELCTNQREYGYNLNEGGRGGKNPTAEVRIKLSIAMKNRIVKDDTRKKISDRLHGKKQASHVIENRSGKNTGQKRTQQQRQRISDGVNSSSLFTSRRSMTDTQVLTILLLMKKMSKFKIANLYHVSPHTVAAVRSGRTYKHLHAKITANEISNEEIEVLAKELAEKTGGHIFHTKIDLSNPTPYISVK